jgi:hypothetical protein
MKRFNDGEINNLLMESLKNDEIPNEKLNLILKGKILEKSKKSKTTSFWWLPALSGTIMTLAFIGLFQYYIPNLFIISTISIFGGISILSVWCLTLICTKKFELVEEACL